MRTEPTPSHAESEISRMVAAAKEAIQVAQTEKTYESIRQAQSELNKLPHDGLKEKLQESITFELLAWMKNEEDEVFKRLQASPWSELHPRQKDTLVARLLMNESPGINIHTMMPTSSSYPPPYTSEWEAAFKVLSKLKELGRDFFENEFGDCLQRSTTPPCIGHDRDHRAIGELMYNLTPDAIVLAALRACHFSLVTSNQEVEPC